MVSIGPAARINGPSKFGSSDRSASGKMLSAGHPRSRTAVTPRARTAAGSASPMCTWRSAAAGITMPSAATTSVSSGTACTRPTDAITPPSRSIWTSGVSPPVPSHASGARMLRLLTRRRLRHAGFSELSQLLAELLDLVAEPGRVLEPEILRRLVHLLLEPLDQPLELLGGHLGVRDLPATLALGRGGSLILTTEREEDVRYLLSDRLGIDPVLGVVGELDLTPALGLADGRLHGVGDAVGVHQDGPIHVARRSPDRLDQRGPGAEEPFFVGVEDRDQRHLGEVEPLPEQVDPDQDVELAEPEIPDDLDPLQRVDLRVEVPDADAHLDQIVGQVLRHLLRERGDADPLIVIGPRTD